MEELAEDLQKQLAQIDLLTSRSGNSGFTEFLVLRMQDLSIKMYQEKGHKRPHIHIDYGKLKHAASYAIDNGERLVGSLHKKYDKTVQIWIEKNQSELAKLWDAAQAGKEVENLIATIRGDT